jgi:ubiquinol-cytochrome c reductase cytochrome c1 subunit
MSKGIFRSTLLSVVLASGLITVVQANEGPKLTAPEMDMTNQASLQRGAKYFINYCSGCHSLKYLRYNRLATDIGITNEEGKVAENIVKKDLIFTGLKIGDTIQTAMTEEEGKKWFGVAPPDLSLETRAKGSAWVYNYLRSFYVDPSKPLGVDNLVFPGAAMPDVLGELQGEQKLVLAANGHANESGVPDGHLEKISQGQLTAEQFDAMIYDITNFLTYVGDPVKLERHRIGVWVLLFLVLLTTVLYLLKREYWKDVH